MYVVKTKVQLLICRFVFTYTKIRFSNDLFVRKPVQVGHKASCSATEDGRRLEISDLERRGIVLSM